MNAARTFVLASTCAAVACGGPVRGGHTARDTSATRLNVLAEFVPGHCEDASHRDLTPRVGSIELVETASGQTLLFEHRQGHELLIAENHFDDGPVWVFQVLITAQNLVREWRIPRSVGATGTLRVGRELTEVAHEAAFEAKLASAYLSCSLVPVRSDLPRGSTNPVP